MFRKTPFEVEHDRFYYEPRVFWDAQAVQGTSSGTLVRFNQEHFRNISRFPIRLTKLLLSPVGYLFRSFGASLTPAQWQAFGGVLTRAELSVEYPRGYSGQKRHAAITLSGTDPTGDPSFENTGTPWASSFYGVSRWDFDPAYFAPANYGIGLELSSLRTYGAPFAGLPVGYRASRAVFERTRSWILGHAQLRVDTTLLTAQTGNVSPEGPQPTVVGDAAAFPAASGNAGAWSAGGTWPGGEFARQKANRGLPYTEVTGFAVHIDQRLFDDTIAATAGLPPDVRLAPVSQRIATRCRTLGGGTGEKWWRDGAPLALVTPSVTPAFVRELEDPIVLGPGEAINISLRLPQPTTIEQSSLNPTFSVGVSLAGYACVEDNSRKIPPQPEFLPQPLT
jgi:hypothetical protein